MTPAPGWYDDPERPGAKRWWDGAAWGMRDIEYPSVSEPTPETEKGDFGSKTGATWRETKSLRILVYILAALVALIIIGALLTSRKKETTTAAKTPTASALAAPTPTTAAETTSEPSVTGKVVGTFHRDCLVCDERLKQYIETSNVWCGWEDGKVLVHVRMKNTSVEHVTVDWHPSYTIARGGEHGTGLTSVESDGFDAGEVRELVAK